MQEKMSLEEWQKALTDFCRPSSRSAETSSILTAQVMGDKITTAQRLLIYRVSVEENFLQSLRNNFPACEKLVGEDTQNQVDHLKR